MSDEHRWRFEVEEAFSITGRGTIVVGRLHGDLRNGEPAILQSNGVIRRLERVGIDILCRSQQQGRSSISLALPGVEKGEISPGAVVYAADSSSDPDKLA